jgi:peptidoglycan LD-endopeptidase LytH
MSPTCPGTSPCRRPRSRLPAGARSPNAAGSRLAIVSILLLASGGCGVPERIQDALRGETPHERYGESLDRSGLADTHLGRGWRIAADAAIRAPIEVGLPHREEGRFLAEEPTALSWAIELRRGERLQVAFEQLPSELADWGAPARSFVEVYRLESAGNAEPARRLLVAWSDGDPAPADTLLYEAARSSTYLVRIQPELLAGGPFRVELRSGASLAFPVEGHTTGHIQSFFGAARDGGRREHHGVDIFAPRGTPVLAAGPGVVRRVRETPIGGRVVWVFDEARNLNRYYAHLDSQLVSDGQAVRAGDTIGTVGNTGNARTTPPHLHFGIYARGQGPVDPWPFLHEPATAFPAVRVDAALYGEPAVLGDDTVVRVVSGASDRYRVRLAGSADRAGHHRLVSRSDIRPLPSDAVAARGPGARSATSGDR